MSKNTESFVEFVCPDCGHPQMEQYFNGPHTVVVLEPHTSGDFEYGNYQSSSCVDRMQCAVCGYILQDKDGNNITDNKEAAQWCLDNCKQR